MIRDPIYLRIPLTVTTNVGQAIRGFGIRPEVRRLAQVIVLVAAGRRCRLVNDREWTFRKRLLRLALQPRPGGGEILVAVANPLSSQLQLLRVKQKYSPYRCATRLWCV